MTQPEKNKSVFEYISQNHKIDEFTNNSKRVEINQAVYEIRVLPIQSYVSVNKPPYFLFINDITSDIRHLNYNLKNIWLYSFIGLIASLLLLLLTLHVSLRRITLLSRALPLLSKNHFNQFRQQIPQKGSSELGYDELDKLNLTALNLADQLERLEYDVRGQTFSLMEKSHELAKERDFIGQLIELAPIIVIIQKLNGIIITINHAGMDALEMESSAIIGKVFDVFLPEGDQEHIKN